MAALDLLSCSAIDADLMVKPLAGGRYQVTGRARAKLEQACVISLDPIASDLDEPIDVEFRAADDMPDPGGAVLLDEADEIEPIESGILDLGKLVYDYLASAVDPYPRKPGAVLDETGPGSKQDAPGGPSGPFAALARLKERDTKPKV